jgi:hypothetical protein
LRANGVGQDWYESRGQNVNLLTLDVADVGGNSGKKARLGGGTNPSTDNVYLTQELSSAQTGTFSVQWDIYVDQILNIGSPDRSGIMMLGSTSASYGPNRNDVVRFVFLAFYKDGGGTSGAADLVAMSAFGTFTTVASGLSLDQWYTIRVVVNVAAKTYKVYVDGVDKGSYAAVTAWAQPTITHISFAQWNDGAGAFYVDNVFSPAVDRYKLSISTVGSGSVTANPAEATYAKGSLVTLTATPVSGWSFSGWSGHLTGTENPANVTMSSNKNITATFTYLNTPPEATNLSISPENPKTTEELVCNYTYYDAEGDPEDGTEIRWYKNDVLQPELNDTLTVSSSLTSKGEVWHFTVRPKDGKDFGELKTSLSVNIQNSAPSIGGVEITPDPAFNTSTLTATPVGWLDDDNDLEGYTYQWQKWNGTTWENITGAISQTLDPQCFIKGDQIKVFCTPYDGEDYGAPQEDVITISNSAPTIDSYYPIIDPTISEGQTQEFNITYSDLDNDVITIRWYLNGTSVSNDTDSYDFNAEVGSAGIYNVTVIISDGSAQDAYMWTLTVVVGNTPPVAFDLSISPSLPTTTDDLVGDYTYFDGNGDPESGTEIKWYKDGVLQPELNDTLTVSSSLTSEDEIWYFSVKPKDGIDFGELQISLSVTVQNSPPTIEEYYPLTESPTIIEGESQLFNITYHDDDGDVLTVQWLLDGSSVGSGDEYIFTADYDDSGAYNVTVVVSDGELSVKHEWTLTVTDVGPTLLMPFNSDESPVAVDESGYGNNGTVYGAEWTSDYGGCYFFNATEKDYIVIPDSASLDGGGTWTEITIEFWIKPTIDNKGVRLVEKRSAGNSYQIGFQTTPSAGVTGNQLYWNVWTTVGYKEIVAPFGLVTGAWSHVVCTYKSAVGMTIYVNGVAAISASHSGTITDSTCPVNIGRYGGAASSYFTGFIDDLRLYTKALPVNLIQKHYTETGVPHADYTLTITTTGSGTVSVNPVLSKYPYASTVTLTAVADPGYMFDHWEINGMSVGSDVTYLVTMDSNKAVTAFFRN